MTVVIWAEKPRAVRTPRGAVSRAHDLRPGLRQHLSRRTPDRGFVAVADHGRGV